MLTTDTFATLFTREGLRPFQPKAGAEGFIPTLEIHTSTEVVVYVLALEAFNDGPTRFGYLRQLGATCAAAHGIVQAVRFGSEAWMRAFTPDEMAARGSRLVETYPDRQEVMVVMGQMADGPGYMAQAPLYRRASGRVERLGEWQIACGSAHRSPLLDAFWEGYHAAQAPD